MKITLDLWFDLDYAKSQYRIQFNMGAKERVTRADLKGWFGSMLESDVDSI